MRRHYLVASGVLVGLGGVAACGGSDKLAAPSASCAIPLEQFHDAGAERSTIPALTNPKVALRGTPDIAYLLLSDRVIGFTFNGQFVAMPHKFLWHHEVVNLQVPGESITITYSALTGSSAVFNRLPAGIGPMSVSKHVLNSNLVMSDGTASLWSQMSNLAACGPSDGVALARVPFEEMTLGAWISLHPNTFIASSATGLGILYTLYPYGDYRELNNTRLIYPVASGIDPRRPPKELVLGVPAAGGGMAFSLTQLDQLRGAIDVFVSAANADLSDGRPITVFWNAFAQGAKAYVAEMNGQRLHFDIVGGQRRDVETGSAWNFDGEAFEGALAGAQLSEIEDAFVSYWFAWAAFRPGTEVWSPPASLELLPVSDLEFPAGPIDWELSTR